MLTGPKWNVLGPMVMVRGEGKAQVDVIVRVEVGLESEDEFESVLVSVLILVSVLVSLLGAGTDAHSIARVLIAGSSGDLAVLDHSTAVGRRVRRGKMWLEGTYFANNGGYQGLLVGEGQEDLSGECR